MTTKSFIKRNYIEDNILPKTLVNVFKFARKYGGYWIGHLPVLKKVLPKFEDLLNNKGLPTSYYRKFLARSIHWIFGHTIFYLDYENGDDVNDGSTWALAWKTITDGATEARIAPGDTIRMAKSTDPASLGITATFTDNSATVTLASALTTNIEMCETVWSASADVTPAVDIYNKEGTNDVKLTIASDFGTGKIAYKDISTLDLSGHEQITFWIYCSATLAANTLRIDLCSDNSGDTPVNSFTINHALLSYDWYPIHIDSGGALGGAIESIAITALLDPGSVYLKIDDFLACDSFSLQSLIGKNSANESWWSIKSINGTTIILGNSDAFGSKINRYSGETESVTIYQRGTIKTDIITSGNVQEVQDSGSSGSPITFSGGWNTSTTTQDGETWFDGLVGDGNGIGCGKNYITFDKIGLARYYRAYYSATENSNQVFTNFTVCGSSGNGIYMSGCYNATFTDILAIASGSGGLSLLNLYGANITNIRCLGSTSSGIALYRCSDIKFTNVYTNSNGTGISFEDVGEIRMANIQSKNNEDYAIEAGFYPHHRIFLKDLVTSGNSTAAIFQGDAMIFLDNALIGEATEIEWYSSQIERFSSALIQSQKHDQTANNHKTFSPIGTITAETSIRHTASGLSWKIAPTSSERKLKLLVDGFKVPVMADSEVTITVYVRKDSSYNGNAARLILRGGILAGIDSDVIDTHTAVADEWEQLSVSGTPTEEGVLEFYIDCDGTAGNIYVDDVNVNQ